MFSLSLFLYNSFLYFFPFINGLFVVVFLFLLLMFYFPLIDKHFWLRLTFFSVRKFWTLLQLGSNCFCSSSRKSWHMPTASRWSKKHSILSTDLWPPAPLPPPPWTSSLRLTARSSTPCSMKRVSWHHIHSQSSPKPSNCMQAWPGHHHSPYLLTRATITPWQFWPTMQPQWPLGLPRGHRVVTQWWVRMSWYWQSGKSWNACSRNEGDEL